MWSKIKKYWSLLVKYVKNFFIRFFHGSKVSLLSFKAYFHYKKLLVIVLFKALIITALILAFFIIIFTFLDKNPDNDLSKLQAGILWLALLFGMFFTQTFFAVVTAYTIDDYCQHNKASLLQTLVKSFKKIHLILIWSALLVFLRGSASKDSKDIASPEASFWGFITNTAWRYLSFFIIPVFAFEQETFFGSLKKCASLTNKYFASISGAVFMYNLLVRLAFFLIMGFGGLSYAIFLFLARFQYFQQLVESLNPGYFIVFIFTPYILIGSMFIVELFVTADVFTNTILYRYVHNLPTGIFNRNVLEEATKER